MNPAVARSIAILKLVAERGPLGASEIARELVLPRSSVHELVGTLRALGCLAPSPAGPAKLDLGLLLHELGSAYTERIDLSALARRRARAMAARCGETVHVAVLDGTDVVYLVKVDSIHRVRMVSSEGTRLPAHCTAVGKALLSGLTDGELRSRYAGRGRLEAMTPNSIVRLGRLLEELRAVRESGLSFDRCESNRDVCCVGAPVRDGTGHVVAAVSVSTPTFRVGRDWPDVHRELVAEGARELSLELGYRPGHEAREEGPT